MYFFLHSFASQERPAAGISLQPAQQLVFGHIQPDHHALAQFAPVRRHGDDAATGGHHQRMPLAELLQHLPLQAAEALFPIAGKEKSHHQQPVRFMNAPSTLQDLQPGTLSWLNSGTFQSCSSSGAHPCPT